MRSLGILLVAVFFLPSALGAQARPWVSAYYAGWMQDDLPPAAIDFDAVTHIMHFSIVPEKGPSLSGDEHGITPAATAAIVEAAHRAGKKVLITCGGEGTDQAFASATNSRNLGRFVRNLVGFVLDRGYDGIDIDWEPITSPGQFARFIPQLRAELDAARHGLLLTIAAATGDGPTISPLARYFDQVNIMTYDLSGPWEGWVVWHNSPLYDGGYRFASTGELLPSANGCVDAFVAAGIPARRIGIGADFYGYVWSGVTRPRQAWTATPEVRDNVPYHELMKTYGVLPVQWDAAAEAAFISIPGGSGTFVSFDSERSLSAKSAYIRRKGIGGMIIWELGGGYQAEAPEGQRDHLLKAVKAAFAEGAPSAGTPR